MTDDADFFSLDDDFPKSGIGLDPPIISVYLASALTNLDEQQRVESTKGRSIIRDVFSRYDYFGVRFQVYDPAEVTAPGSRHSDEEVYTMDHHQTAKADLVVFYLLAPSLGVGMEAQITADCTLPRVVVSKRGSAVSRMFRGVFSPTISRIDYDDVAELRAAISDAILAIAESTVGSSKCRREHLAEFCDDALGRKIMRHRLAVGMPLRTLAQKTDICESWLQSVELDASLAPSVTLMQLHRIANTLGVKASITESGLTTIPSAGSNGAETESFDNLADFLKTFALDEQKLPDDRHVLSLWQDFERQFVEERDEALRHRGAESKVVSVEEWRRRYNARDGRLF